MDFPKVTSTQLAIRSAATPNRLSSNKNQIKLKKISEELYDKASSIFQKAESNKGVYAELIADLGEILILSNELKEIIGGVKNAQKNSSSHR